MPYILKSRRVGVGVEPSFDESAADAMGGSASLHIQFSRHAPSLLVSLRVLGPICVVSCFAHACM